MGDHTDYNEGFVLPFAIDREVVVSASPRTDDVVRVTSVEHGSAEVAAGGACEPAAVEPPWARSVAGVVAALARRGRAPVGADIEVTSTVPEGSGLSSSAAFEVACALALCDVAGLELSPRELALACQEAEQAATGVPSGVMDQLASLCGREGDALLIDCRSLAVEQVPLPAAAGFVAVHSGVPRRLEETAYAEKRTASEDAARRLGVRALRDATLEQVADDPVARHVVTENGRVNETAAALRDGDLARVGELFAESHASLRDDFGVSTPELDVLVDELVAAGAFGARLTGAGFGGSVVAVCPVDGADAVGETAASRYRARTGLEPTPLRCRPVAGAGPVAP